MNQKLSELSPKILLQTEGPLRFRMTNAYLFVAVLQKNQEALCHLIAALLHIKRSDILSVEIKNPIVLGQTIDDKDCVLDLFILLNGNIRINLEMQVTNEYNWDNRSLYYLASKLVDLPIGADYNQLQPVMQIGILDFNYPSDNEEFYQQIYLMNRKTHKIYNDKASIHVLCLPQIEKATPEDRASGLYHWAKVFQATTWKELIDLSENDPVIEDTVVTIASLSADEKIRQQCERHEKYERDRISLLNYANRQYQEGHDAGVAEGHVEGHTSGILDGVKLFPRLNQKLQEANRVEEMQKALNDPAYLNKLLKEFELI